MFLESETPFQHFLALSLINHYHSSKSLFLLFCHSIFAGNTDIHGGNLKLILALLWTLIAHYQLGASNFPPKKLMLAWLRVSFFFFFTDLKMFIHLFPTFIFSKRLCYQRIVTSRISPLTGTMALTFVHCLTIANQV